MMTTELQQLVEQGKQAFAAKEFERAVSIFSEAVSAYEAEDDTLNVAEMKNNLSVALLQAGKPQAALGAASGTDEIFAQAQDVKRQAMALGNQAAALEALKKFDQALEAYERSAELFADAGESEMRSIVLQSAAAIKLRRGKLMDSAFSMIGSVEATPKPNLLHRFLRFLLRFIKP
jgi:tetratricopeptide (TPR) repeat protein